MKAQERRKEIVACLMAETEPVAGAMLAERLHVSRQIIVQDIAMLKAQGFEILSTHRGYIIKSSPLVQRVFKVRHTGADTEDELSCIVELGGTVVDVFVWHKVYGKIAAGLNIFSRRSVEQFIDGIRSGRSTELMHITDGYHYHTIRADSEAMLDRIGQELERRGYLAPEIG